MTNSRRNFITSISMLAASSAVPISAFAFTKSKKLKIVLVGTGSRGISFWGKRLVDQYSEILEFVGLCDINPGRLEYAKGRMGVDCPTYVDFDLMMEKSSPDLVIVTTKDSTHHEFIIKALEKDCDVLTEKPLTTDAFKCQAILEAEKKSKKKVIVGFNYRWTPYSTKIKELLMKNTIGKITSVDFHWYLNTYHGASYFRRWHGEIENSGSLWVHKATHHFDILNWWLDSEPKEVFAYGDLDFYGKNGDFRGVNCRTCPHSSKCDFHYDITKNKTSMEMYVANEKHDGYAPDKCLFREEIDIYDKMSAQIKYENNVVLNYSLTTYSPFEGWRVAFNGTEGRIEAWVDIPYNKNIELDQSKLHTEEMDQAGNEGMEQQPIIIHRLWKDYDNLNVVSEKGGHGGGDKRLQDSLFLNPSEQDPYGRSAGLRDGAMSCLIGIAAVRSIEEGTVVKIKDLTELVPTAVRS
ncbi:Gfo/Idh/MocA family protein [Kriegella aquimaris]|uniref:Oxidoreductase family, C-terminal alpha/beta domain n=1 Tax=Kriegella aquimaris TaxID=192904 RepID=A0A1G9VI87_9FLAO|nr:Gfo/Idh/MocA family oxidoreductase [Kriegella aquimaris]SDM71535.1 Oxidoreductase family, C-terminal alpha/beta domain [Kriegella aquimaris]